jgi:glycosyltransferase involved in cell wall biosynthesis
LKVIFVNRFYRPDTSATSQMLTDLAERLAGEGMQVVIVTSPMLYQDAAARLPGREDCDGVAVHRVVTTRFGRRNLVGRALDYASFYFSATVRLCLLVRRGDTVVAKTDPPLISIPCALVAAIRGARLVNWLQDIYPEVAERLGVGRPLRAAFPVLRRLRNWSLHRAATNVVIGSAMRRFLLTQGVERRRIRTIPNWAPHAGATPDPQQVAEFRARAQVTGRFVAMYSGNLGRAHDPAAILQAARSLRDDTDIVFLLIGGGAGMEVLARAARQEGLANLRFLGYQERSQLPVSLAAGDVHVLSLLAPLEGVLLPSKLYGILAAGKPFVFVGDEAGEIARFARAAECGCAAASGDRLAEQLRNLHRDPALRERWGINARLQFVQRFTLDGNYRKWRAVLRDVPHLPD